MIDLQCRCYTLHVEQEYQEILRVYIDYFYVFKIFLIDLPNNIFNSLINNILYFFYIFSMDALQAHRKRTITTTLVVTADNEIYVR